MDIGLTLWFGMVTVTAMLVVLGLTYLPSLRRVSSGSQPIHTRNVDRHCVRARRQSGGRPDADCQSSGLSVSTLCNAGTGVVRATEPTNMSRNANEVDARIQ